MQEKNLNFNTIKSFKYYFPENNFERIFCSEISENEKFFKLSFKKNKKAKTIEIKTLDEIELMPSPKNSLKKFILKK